MDREPPLSGLLVADFSRVLAGPLATSWLADLGARVIKVERPDGGDETRHWGPPWFTDAAGSRSASYFESANRTKESVALDLGDADDLALAHRLVARADVVVENFRDGALTRFGLDAESVRARHERVIYASLTGFGTSAGAELPGYDFLVQAAGGLMSITGAPEGPSKVGVALVDVLAAKDLLTGVLAALLQRERTSRGGHVQVSLMMSLLAALANQASAALATGVAPERLGNRHPSIAPYQLIRAADGDLVLAVGNDRQFAALATTIGSPGLASDPRFVTNSARVAHVDELCAALESALAVHSVVHWVERLMAAGVPAGSVNSIPEAFEVAHRLGLAPTVAVPGALDQVRNPVLSDAWAPVAPSAPPRLDEHGDAVRAWLSADRHD